MVFFVPFIVLKFEGKHRETTEKWRRVIANIIFTDNIIDFLAINYEVATKIIRSVIILFYEMIVYALHNFKNIHTFSIFLLNKF